MNILIATGSGGPKGHGMKQGHTQWDLLFSNPEGIANYIDLSMATGTVVAAYNLSVHVITQHELTSYRCQK